MSPGHGCGLRGRPHLSIWYDPEDPAKVTAFGPGHWIMLSLVWGVSLVSLFGLGLRLAGKAG